MPCGINDGGDTCVYYKEVTVQSAVLQHLVDSLPYLDEGVDKTVSLRSAEEPDRALLDDVVVDPARHGDCPRAPRDDHLGQQESLGQSASRGAERRRHRGKCW